MKIQDMNQVYRPKTLNWECEPVYNRYYWIISAHAYIPGAENLEVSAEIRMPFSYVARIAGLTHYVDKAVRDMTISISYKYQMLVRNNAAVNKHAATALEEIRNWEPPV